MEYEIIDDFWEDPTQTDDKGNPIRSKAKPEDEWRAPWDSRAQASSRFMHVTRVIYPDGRIYDIDDSGRQLRYVRTDPQAATQYRADQKANQPKETGPTTRQGPDKNEYQWNADAGQWQPAPGIPQAASQPSAPTLKEFPDGSLRQYDPQAGQWSTVGQPTSDPQEQALRRRLLEAQVASAERGPQAPQRAPRYPDEERLAQLNIQKAERDLMNQYVLAQQQAYEAIENIRGQMASGQLQPEQAEKQMGLIRQNLEASLKGTTPWQMDKQKQDLARNVTQDRMQAESGIGQSLLTGLLGAYGKLRTSNNPPPMPDPFAMAKGYASEMGGGQEMSDLAKSVLMGALGQQQGGM